MPTHTIFLWFAYSLGLGCLSSVGALLNADAGQDDIQFERDVLPILQTHCIRCHGPDVQEANLRLDNLSIHLNEDRAATESWHEVLNAIQANKMPPPDEEPLSSEQLTTVTQWVSNSIQAALAERRKTDGRVVVRRLNRVEYQHTMQDLLGLEMDYARDLPPDAVSADGFHNNGRSLQMSSLQLEYYLATARRAMDRVIVQGEQPPAIHHSFTTTSIDNWLGEAERSNRLGRRQEFLVKMVDNYPDDGDFLVRVQLTADLKPATGYPLLEVSVGYQIDTEILMREFDLVEVTSPDSQTFEFRGRQENFPLPVRGQGKFPGLVVRVRNVYDDKSPRPEPQKDEHGKITYPNEDHLPTLNIQSVEFHGNHYEQWPPVSHRQILLGSTDTELESTAYLSQVLQRFMARAYRRKVTETEVGKFVAFYQEIRPEFPSFEETIRETLALVLIQPDFLFLLEPAGEEKRLVDEFELAARLSYFLWNTMPDERLIELATAGTLRANLEAEVERMVADPRAQRFVKHFTDQWLELNFVENVAVNRDRFPGFDDRLKRDMTAETHAVFAEILKENASAIQLLSSDFTMLNESLAKHYGIDGVFGLAFRRVALSPELHRGSLLSHASILLSNSTGADSHPIRRAVWIRDRLLNDPPAPPPPNVPSLEEANPEFHKLSVREQLEIHRSVESCNQCHRSLDPWGIALENFDAVGKWRTDLPTHAGDATHTQAVAATVVLPDGREVAGADGLRQYLAGERKQEFARSLVSRLLTYALGRSLELTDEAAVDHVLEQFAEDDYRLQELIHKVVASEPFQTK
ncbi:MAG: DUF1592 domain-containing protein [Pirellulaceae bacterium]|nr:DUF1592 domain-containing protein [Pirellulaceae bacterium]